MNSMFFRAFSVIVLSLGLAPGAASASTVATFNTLDQGWISASGSSFAAVQNYAAGRFGLNTLRSFFLWDLEGASSLDPTGTGPFSDISINITGNGLVSDQGQETLALYDVTPATTFCLMTANCGQSGYNDLGTGNELGSVTITSGTGDQLITLSADAVIAINDAINAGTRFFAFGAAVTTLSGPGDQAVNFATNGFGPYTPTQFVATLGTSPSGPGGVIPVPGAIWLFGSGLIGLAGFVRRRAA